MMIAGKLVQTDLVQGRHITGIFFRTKKKNNTWKLRKYIKNMFLHKEFTSNTVKFMNF